MFKWVTRCEIYNRTYIRPASFSLICSRSTSGICLMCNYSFIGLRYNELIFSRNLPPIIKGLRPISCWDCLFESRRGHGYLSLEGIVCFHVKAFATELIPHPEDIYRLWCVYRNVIRKTSTSGRLVPSGLLSYKNINVIDSSFFSATGTKLIAVSTSKANVFIQFFNLWLRLHLRPLFSNTGVLIRNRYLCDS